MKIEKKNHNLKYFYQVLKKKKKLLKTRSIIFALFLLVVNSYAWFVYVSKADLTLSGNVVSWDVKFHDESSEIMDFDIEIDQLYPGMSVFEKSINILNSSDFEATFSYELSDLYLFGEFQDITNEEILNFLNSGFPFQFEFISSNEHLESGNGYSRFTIQAYWPYESNNPYSKVIGNFKYHSGIDYYIFNDGVYQFDETVDEINFEEKKKQGLYVESDDWDTIWGESAITWKENHPNVPCLTFNLKLIVQQEKVS